MTIESHSSSLIFSLLVIYWSSVSQQASKAVILTGNSLIDIKISSSDAVEQEPESLDPSSLSESLSFWFSLSLSLVLELLEEQVEEVWLVFLEFLLTSHSNIRDWSILISLLFKLIELVKT